MNNLSYSFISPRTLSFPKQQETYQGPAYTLIFSLSHQPHWWLGSQRRLSLRSYRIWKSSAASRASHFPSYDSELLPQHQSSRAQARNRNTDFLSPWPKQPLLGNPISSLLAGPHYWPSQPPSKQRTWSQRRVTSTFSYERCLF